MSKTRAISLGVVGVLAALAAIFGSIAPPAFLGSKGVLVMGLLFIVGLLMIGGAIALYQKSRITTVTITMGKQAEKDASALTKMEFAVERGQSAEEVVPVQKNAKHLVVPPEVFATLNKEQTQYAAKGKNKSSKKNAKSAPVQLPKEILRVAKRKKASKKKK